MLDEQWQEFSNIVNALRAEKKKHTRIRMSYMVIGSKSYGFTIAEHYAYDGNDPFFAKRKTLGFSICVHFADTGKSLTRAMPIEMIGDLDRIWLHYCTTAKYYPEYATGAGGSTYYFGCSSNAIDPLAGRTWTPKLNSPLHRLISLADLITHEVKKGGEWVPVKEALSAAIKDTQK
jgi:hypothetical protein